MLHVNNIFYANRLSKKNMMNILMRINKRTPKTAPSVLEIDIIF